ncbi:MAG TPA: glycogen synthase GlgA [Pyrinomonadaceae bacterium]|jgi:starch synthase|nr:glycogen synthase GlgA [Pyrinomonadaceae bacterium]
MRIAFLSSEVVPFAKTGGLADVAGALPKALRQLGHDAIVLLPLYQQVDRSLLTGVIEDVPVDWRGQSRLTRVFQSEASGVPAYLIDAPEYFSRDSIYGFRDDFERFAFFGRAALTVLRYLDWAPDIVHANDWPGGFPTIELRARRRFDPFFEGSRSVFSIHNLAYQGQFKLEDLWWLGLGDYRDQNDFKLEGIASALKAGLMSADALSTVSRRYAYEIQTPEQGYGLDWLLRMRRNRLLGITNGVDYDFWNPETDPHIAANFTADDLSGKQECKRDLLRRFGLPEEVGRPVIAIISRLVAQKGYDLIQPLARAILETGSFFIALGAGAQEYEDFLQSWHEAAPHRVGIYKGYAGEPLAHQIEAGADMFLMPSHYEPCGLNQMYSMRYGTVPIVRATGGLDDTVQNFDARNGTGNGFKFQDYSARALLEKIREALYFYSKPEAWQVIQRNGMVTDNSWPTAAQRYVDLYDRLLKL